MLEVYPEELGVVFFSNLCLTIISAPVCLIAEKNLSSWRIELDIALGAIVFSVSIIQLASLRIYQEYKINHPYCFFFCLGILGFCLWHDCIHMGSAFEGPCLYCNVQSIVHCHCDCHGGHVPWRYFISWKVYRIQPHQIFSCSFSAWAPFLCLSHLFTLPAFLPCAVS